MPGFPLPDEAFRLAVLAVLVLAVLAFGFCLFTFYLRIRSRNRERLWKRLEERWTGPLLEALADPDRIPALQETVEDRYALFFVSFCLRYFRRVRGEEREILKRAASPWIARAAARASSPRVEIRARAVQTLGALGLPRYGDRLVEALDDASPLVAMVAARALAREGDERYVEPLVRRLKRFRSWRDSALASMLAGIGVAAMPRLRQTLADENEDPWVRTVAAAALAQLADLEAGDVAARVVEHGAGRGLLAAALDLLAEVGRPEHRAPVRIRCASPDFVVRSRALRALGRLGNEEEDAPRLRAALDDPSPWVALDAARGLREVGGIPALREIAASGHPRAAAARQVLGEEGVE